MAAIPAQHDPQSPQAEAAVRVIEDGLAGAQRGVCHVATLEAGQRFRGNEALPRDHVVSSQHNGADGRSYPVAADGAVPGER